MEGNRGGEGKKERKRQMKIVEDNVDEKEKDIIFMLDTIDDEALDLLIHGKRISFRWIEDENDESIIGSIVGSGDEDNDKI